MSPAADRRPPEAASNARRAGITTALVCAGAALAEIAGCFAFGAWLRLGHSALWVVPGLISLTLFSYLLTLINAAAAGRAYAAYGGAYITSSLVWLWLVESVRPDRWGVTGAALCLAGAAVIIAGPS